MRKIYQWGLVICLAFAKSLPAQTVPVPTLAMDSMVNEALNNAQSMRSQAQAALPSVDASGLGPSSPVNPAQIAAKYRELLSHKQGEAAQDNPSIIIFVSSSMPKESLRRLGVQAQKVGATVVLRGLKNGLGKGSLQALIDELAPMVNTGADIQIHPELFRRFNVRTVPTFVVSDPLFGCGLEACAGNSLAVSGDVSLDYALKELAKSSSTVAQIARKALLRFEPKP